MFILKQILKLDMKIAAGNATFFFLLSRKIGKQDNTCRQKHDIVLSSGFSVHVKKNIIIP